jgi:hypothetical protein
MGKWGQRTFSIVVPAVFLGRPRASPTKRRPVIASNCFCNVSRPIKGDAVSGNCDLRQPWHATYPCEQAVRSLIVRSAHRQEKSSLIAFRKDLGVAVSHADAAERQVDARAAWTRFFFDPMLPIALGVAFHQEKAAGRKFQANRLQSLLALVFQDEGPFFSQT